MALPTSIIGANNMKKFSYYLITLLVPIIFFVVLEMALRVFGYGADQPKAFISDSIDPQYQIMNPKVSLRYFSDPSFAPSGAYDLFKKTKADSTFRIFVQGASSSAGFPFRAASFPRLLEQKLQAYFPSLDIEVVNTSLVATNSYTVLDLADEIIEQQPDAVIIYGGHNEFYGALGVGSSQSLGRSPRVTNFYLRLKNVRLVQLLRSAVKGIYSSAGKNDANETLMAKMVREESISLDSRVYKAGLRQYEYNLSRTIEKYRSQGVPVFLSTLVSNIRDFEPFESSEPDSAMVYFDRGTELVGKGEYALAKKSFTEARNRDLLKFRATSDLQMIIHELGNQEGVNLLDMEEAFTSQSTHGIIGNELLVEHVHPNLTGQRLLADKAFKGVARLLSESGVKSEFPVNFEYAIAPLDSLYGHELAGQLMQNWPFTDQTVSANTVPTFLDRLTSGEISWTAVMSQFVYDNMSSRPKAALATARVFLQEFPHQTQPYLMVAQVHASMGDFKQADRVLNSIPEKLKDRTVYEIMVGVSLQSRDYEKAYSQVNDILKMGPDFHYEKVKESLSILIEDDGTGLNREEVLTNPAQFINRLEALILLQNMEEARELNNNLLKLIPQNEALKRINQRGVL